MNRAPSGVEGLVYRYLRGETLVVPARDAATVLVVRDSAAGVEVFLQRRSAGMASSAGRFVFPGGLVDGSDRVGDVPWAGPAPGEWGAALGCPADEAQALVCAAVRETFEECGILLAGRSADTVVADTEAWRADRLALAAHELSFGEFLRRRSLVVRSDLLRGVSRWITPEWVPRRYDTRFFLARLPAGQRPAEPGGESDATMWAPVDHVVADHDDGLLPLMLPTASVLRLIAGTATAEEALAGSYRLGPVRFRLVPAGDGGARVYTTGPAGDEFAYAVEPEESVH